MSENATPKRIVVTGATGFVGSAVVRELTASGRTAVCLVRDAGKLAGKTRDLASAAVVPVVGSAFDENALATALEGADAAIHLIGIILESKRQGQTFHRLHVESTRQIVAACERAGVKRYVHMSALGARPAGDGVSDYHRTKWEAEEAVRASGLDWTLFRPSLIHGPDGEFMQMMRFFATSRVRQPFMPYFGRGEARIQPVDVRDVARCFVRALALPETIGQTYALGGPEVYTWKELYDVCARAIRGRPRRLVGIPVPVARLAARLAMPVLPAALVPYKFNVGQVLMSQQDSTCATNPVEDTFGLALRPFRAELAKYADRIRPTSLRPRPKNADRCVPRKKTDGTLSETA